MPDKPDIESILELIRDGSTYREIGAKLGVNASTVCRWLAENESIAQQSARAREDSAEAWLDRGLGYLESALNRDSGLDAGAARALAQECARRAAVRNPRYRESQKVDLEHSGSVKVEKVVREVIDPKA